MSSSSNSRISVQRRTTGETDISLTVRLDSREKGEIHTGVPFFDHMLTAMSFHGGFTLEVNATGDVDVDAHHLVEDTGLVLGQAFGTILDNGGLVRFGEARVPMDDALGEAIVDAGGRPYLVYRAEFPQAYAGAFDLSLVREFFYAFAVKARCNVHIHAPYGVNGHHMAEALFKAFGIAVGRAFSQSGEMSVGTSSMSTKGVV